MDNNRSKRRFKNEVNNNKLYITIYRNMTTNKCLKKL